LLSSKIKLLLIFKAFCFREGVILVVHATMTQSITGLRRAGLRLGSIDIFHKGKTGDRRPTA
jgi:hypothetical protein